MNCYFVKIKACYTFYLRKLGYFFIKYIRQITRTAKNP